MKTVEVVAAVIEYEQKILCMQRGASKYEYVSEKFEFPGGKIEQGESAPQALMRELREELEMETNIKVSDYFMTVHYAYPDFAITMHAYRFKVNNPNFIMREHISYIWADPNDIDGLTWAPADIEIVRAIKGGNNG